VSSRIAKAHRKIHTQRQEYLPYRVIKPGKGLRQFDGDEAVCKNPQLSRNAIRVLVEDPESRQVTDLHRQGQSRRGGDAAQTAQPVGRVGEPR
jgi:hypothetical protein